MAEVVPIRKGMMTPVPPPTRMFRVVRQVMEEVRIQAPTPDDAGAAAVADRGSVVSRGANIQVVDIFPEG